MMEKIFAHNKVVFLTTTNTLKNLEDNVLFINYDSHKTLKTAYKLFIKEDLLQKLYVYYPNAEVLRSDFFSLFKLIEAAGGLVYSPEGKLLMIFRNGKWDLPKGKIEKGEHVRQAAVREVMEECGIPKVEIVSELSPSYHIYSQGGKNIVKKTHWFSMSSPLYEKLRPQLDEGITEVKWMSGNEVAEALKDTYPSIEQVIRNFRTA